MARRMFAASRRRTTSPPPPPNNFLWGSNTSISLVDSTRAKEMDDMIASGCNFVRISSTATSIIDLAAARAFDKFVVLISSSISGVQGVVNNLAGSPIPNLVSRYGSKLIIEAVNEPNFMNTPVAQQGVIFRDFYRVVKGSFPNTEVILPSIGNSSSSLEHLNMMQWAQGLVNAGCVLGDGFDRANYHTYNDQSFFHIWTPDGTGNSCQKIFGFPEFYVTEFGKNENGISEASYASIIGQEMDEIIAARPKCVGAVHYLMSEDGPGSGAQPPSYGLRKHDLTHKLAWDVFLAKSAL